MLVGCALLWGTRGVLVSTFAQISLMSSLSPYWERVDRRKLGRPVLYSDRVHETVRTGIFWLLVRAIVAAINGQVCALEYS